MPCCLCCCGNTTCSDGQQVGSKCCCGGGAGQCCTSGQYCCNGVCQTGPCCDPPCQYGEYCCDGQCQEEPCCNLPSLSYYFVGGAGGSPTSRYEDGITITLPATDNVGRPLTLPVTVHIRTSAISMPQGPYFSRFKYRTSLTGDEEYSVNGFQVQGYYAKDDWGPSNNPFIYAQCIYDPITIEITEYQTGNVIAYGQDGVTPVFSTPCSGPNCPQCFDTQCYRPGWLFEVYYDQSYTCDCPSPLP